MYVTEEQLRSIADEAPIVDEMGNYCLLEPMLMVVSLAAAFAISEPAIAVQLNNATIDYIQAVQQLTVPLNTDADLGELRLRPVEQPTKPVEVINVQQS